MIEVRRPDLDEFVIYAEDSETCEQCWCREAYGTYDYQGVETWLCGVCAP